MVDPISVISGGMSIAKGSYDFLNFIHGIKDTDVIAALFDEEGNRTDGSNKIEVEKLPSGNRPDIWWYSVKEIPGYVFDRIPLTASCVMEEAGCITGEQNPHADRWRWRGFERRGDLYNGTNDQPNIKVSFIVVGYKPKALLKYFTS
jgi:hypothetical protein